MKQILLLGIILFSLLAHSQVEQELVYPLVPIIDECHNALDNSDSIIIMSREDFLQLDSLWSTLNTCYNDTADTLWMKQFEITFAGLMNDGKSSYLVNDGNLKNEYLSSLEDSRKFIKPYDHIHIRDVQYEQNGGMYQVDDIHIVIDSLVVPELDTCWRYFPMLPSGLKANINIYKSELTTLLTDSFGYNSCTGKMEWPNDSHSVHMWFAPRLLTEHYISNVYINDFELTNTTHMEPIITRLNNLSYGDVVAFRRSVYIRHNAYRHTPEYRFTITDQKPCSSTYDIQSAESTAIYTLIDSIRKSTIDPHFCFVNSNGQPVSFRFVTVPKKGAASVLSVSNGRLNDAVISHIRKLKSGDKIVLERLFSYDLETDEKTGYEPKLFIIK